MAYVRNQQADIHQQVRPSKDCSGYEGVTEDVYSPLILIMSRLGCHRR